jgi:hypothetical protein
MSTAHTGATNLSAQTSGEVFGMTVILVTGRARIRDRLHRQPREA